MLLRCRTIAVIKSRERVTSSRSTCSTAVPTYCLAHRHGVQRGARGPQVVPVLYRCLGRPVRRYALPLDIPRGRLRFSQPLATDQILARADEGEALGVFVFAGTLAAIAAPRG